MLNRKILPALLVLLISIVFSACGEKAQKVTAMQEKAKDGANGVQEAQPLQKSATGGESAAQPQEMAWVFTERGNRQCEGGGTSLQESATRLSSGGVAVQESRCGSRTDRMYPAVCGGLTGDILLHLISRDSLDTALELGFDPAEQIEFQRRDCPR